jgi:membrane protein YqaA with SNARE-associated domain
MKWTSTLPWSQYLLALGVPGLFGVALVDSAAIPIVGGAESLAMVLAWKEPAHIPWIVLAGTLGSTLGSLISYPVGRAGGALVLPRLGSATQEWVRRQVTHRAFWVLLLAVVLPPPCPTKPLVLAAGAVRTPLPVFLTAIFAGRLLRFSALGYLGFRLGDSALRNIASHYPAVLLTLVGLVVLSRLGLKLRKSLWPS